MRTGNGVVFAVAGAKGGVGKTTTSINLSAVLAELGYDVVLVELDLAMANVGDFLDLDVRLEHAQDPTLHEVLAGTASVSDATYEAPGGFDVIPSGVTLQGFANADIDAVADVVQEVRPGYDVVVLDTGAGLGTMTVLPLSLADETILISSPRVASIRDTKKTEEIVQHVEGTVAGIVFIKSGTGRSPGVDRIATHLSVNLLGHVPEDDDVASAQDIGQPVAIARPESDAATAYQSLGSIVADRIDAFEPAQRRHGAHDATPTTEDVDVSDFDYGDAVDDSVDGREERERERTGTDESEADTGGEDDADEPEAVAGAVDDESEVDTDASETDTTGDMTEAVAGAVDDESETDTTADMTADSETAESDADTTDSETDTTDSEVVTGATDDEIATRLLSLESADAELTTSTDSDTQDSNERLQQTAEQPVEDSSSAGVESSATLDDGVDDPADESRSIVRRLIDRAFGVFGFVGRPRT